MANEPLTPVAFYQNRLEEAVTLLTCVHNDLVEIHQAIRDGDTDSYIDIGLLAQNIREFLLGE